MIDIKGLMEVASGLGIEHCHVEQDQSPNALNSIQQSIGHIKGW